MDQKVSQRKWWLLLPLFLVFAFYFPRFLIQTLGASNPWTNYLYIYGFGLIYSGSGVLLVLKTGACNLKRPKDNFWFKMILFGFSYFAILHAVWIYLSLSIPFLGGQ